jgi:tetratricopeptide (TPR) repeat protein
MKIKQIIIASSLLVSVASFAQKDELKALKKIYDKDTPSAKDLMDYKSALQKAEPLITNATESDKIYYNFFKSLTPYLEMAEAMTKPENANNPQALFKKFTTPVLTEMGKSLSDVVEFEKKSGKQVYTKDIQEMIVQFKPIVLNYAIALEKQGNLKESSQVLYAVYQLDKNDQENLYYAAGYAVNANDYDSALKYYQELKDSNYSGEKTIYFAKNLASNQEEYFNTKNERDNLVKLKTHALPRDEKVPSRRGEINKNIAIILLQKGRNEEAKTAIADARKTNPDDVSLIVTEADLYYKLKDVDTYKRLVNEALAKNPNDANLVFNLGVVSNSANQFDEARKYYTKAIELDPNFIDAYLNLADNILKPDAKLVEDMNKLGSSTSDKDLKKYQALTVERKKLFNEVMPVYEKALEISEKRDQSVESNKVQTDNIKLYLKTVYNYLELSEKSKALKAKM